MSEKNPALSALYVIAGLTFSVGCFVWLAQTLMPEPGSLSELGESAAASVQLLALAFVLMAVGVLSGIAALHASAVSRATYNAAWPDERR